MATALPILEIQEPGTDLARKTVFIKPHLGMLGNSRKVSSSRVEVDADKKLIRVANTLLDSPEPQAIRTLDGDVRRFLYDTCLPFDVGIHLLPLGLLETVDEKLRKFREKRRVLVEVFLLAGVKDRCHMVPIPWSKPTMDDYLAWFDGPCEPANPGGTATFGAVVRDDDRTILLQGYGLVGKGSTMSNNLAEYAGVLHVLKYLSYRPPGQVTIHGDSSLVINQLNGRWRVRKGLYLSTAIEAKVLLAYPHNPGWQINLMWIPREQNEECDMLSKGSC
jgi:ribonuclease HI